LPLLHHSKRALVHKNPIKSSSFHNFHLQTTTSLSPIFSLVLILSIASFINITLLSQPSISFNSHSHLTHNLSPHYAHFSPSHKNSLHLPFLLILIHHVHFSLSLIQHKVHLEHKALVTMTTSSSSLASHTHSQHHHHLIVTSSFFTSSSPIVIFTRLLSQHTS
jgi:hypothetical protein